ncbi:hypothetical protein T265_05729 [Opisthorchis viverrini]|uniref:Uncharacterized protein n=1 Tax=Opisthorchis viverrini TaxID=6198 RepID=A0A074ZJN9_OPIVI|nr:hypothetical protein T265_05729 [Opisthorchis viverrini]KER27196.1 hypothetical protein T265_05729 [Opisthorchis viverrini]
MFFASVVQLNFLEDSDSIEENVGSSGSVDGDRWLVREQANDHHSDSSYCWDLSSTNRNWFRAEHCGESINSPKNEYNFQDAWRALTSPSFPLLQQNERFGRNASDFRLYTHLQTNLVLRETHVELSRTSRLRCFQTTECAAPRRLMFQSLRYSRNRDTFLELIQLSTYVQRCTTSSVSPWMANGVSGDCVSRRMTLHFVGEKCMLRHWMTLEDDIVYIFQIDKVFVHCHMKTRVLKTFRRSSHR